MSEAIKAYYEAFNRLKDNKPINIPKNSAINKDTVALEAGKKRGSIRNRKGFEQLISDIENVAETMPVKRTIPDKSEKLQAAREEIKNLRQQMDVIESRYMSLLYLNFEMAKKLKKHGIDSSKFGEVSNIRINENN